MLVLGNAVEPQQHELESHLSCRIQCSAGRLIGLCEFKMQSERVHRTSPAFGSLAHTKPEVEKGAFDLNTDNAALWHILLWKMSRRRFPFVRGFRQ